MASRTTTKNLGVLIRSVGNSAQEAQKDAVYNASRYTVNVIERRMYRDLNGKNYFTNMFTRLTRTGNEISARDKQQLRLRWNVRGSNNPTSLITAQGPWGLLENGAAKHSIVPRINVRARQKGMTKQQKRRDNAAIAFRGRGSFSGVKPLGNISKGFGPVYSAQHPGTKAKRTFSLGLAQATPTASKIATSLIQNRIIRETRVQFGGGTFMTIEGESGLFVSPGKAG
jgi:hypothetical protein